MWLGWTLTSFAVHSPNEIKIKNGYKQTNSNNISVENTRKQYVNKNYIQPDSRRMAKKQQKVKFLEPWSCYAIQSIQSFSIVYYYSSALMVPIYCSGLQGHILLNVGTYAVLTMIFWKHLGACDWLPHTAFGSLRLEYMKFKPFRKRKRISKEHIRYLVENRNAKTDSYLFYHFTFWSSWGKHPLPFHSLLAFTLSTTEEDNLVISGPVSRYSDPAI